MLASARAANREEGDKVWSLDVHCLEGKMAIVSALLSLREISGSYGGSTCLRKSNDLGKHPARLQDPLANSFLQVGASITKPCYLKRE